MALAAQSKHNVGHSWWSASAGLNLASTSAADRQADKDRIQAEIHSSAMGPPTLSPHIIALAFGLEGLGFHTYALPRAAGTRAHRSSFCQPVLLFNSQDPCTGMGCLAPGRACPQYRDWSHG